MGFNIKASKGADYSVGELIHHISKDSLVEGKHVQTASKRFTGGDDELYVPFSVETQVGEFTWNVHYLSGDSVVSIESVEQVKCPDEVELTSQPVFEVVDSD
jgi:hypothetical protein